MDGSANLGFDGVPTGHEKTTPTLAESQNNKLHPLSIKFRKNVPTLPGDEAVSAVVVLNAKKSYGGAKGKPVLDDFCMTVTQGTIYGLLGSSGCGKTTLLQCILGIKHLNSGQIYIFGSPTGTVGSGVPGKMVGYMPQEIALYKNFSIKETLVYFGNLHGLSTENILNSKKKLLDLLNLPDEKKMVGTLSGGQMRRVSLAISLLHAPPLIILDEPTVGVDPLLRDNIWQHLLMLVSDGKTTVIMTTHYQDEARQCGRVGVMRNGRLLVEKSPTELFQTYSTTNLEKIVLQLCNEDEETKQNGNICKTNENLSLVKINNAKLYRLPSIKKFPAPKIFDSFVRIRALVMKNLVVMIRNLMFILFVIFLPALQTIVMGMAMGNDPKPIRVGVVNHDMNVSMQGGCNFESVEYSGECEVSKMSCKFLQSLPLQIIELSNYETKEDARRDITLGKIRSFMYFPEEYSESMFGRSTSGIFVDNETLQQSTITIEMDASSAIVTKSLQRIVYESYNRFIKRLLFDCGLNPEQGALPIKFENPTYGSYDMEMREFVATGMVVGVALFFPLCSSSIIYIWDKKLGTVERARVAGTQTWEIMTSYFITEGIISVFQNCINLIIIIYLFNVTVIGSHALAISLLLLNGLAGISLGLLIASICTEEIQAILLGLAIVFPNSFLAGSMWPVEGMPIAVQYFSYALPGALACEAFRSIVARGWGLAHFHVWIGFTSTLGWILVYCSLVVYVHKVTLRKT